MLKHGVCFHFIVTWRADGRVTCGKNEEILFRNEAKYQIQVALIPAMNHSDGFTVELQTSPPIRDVVKRTKEEQNTNFSFEMKGS